MSAQVMMKCGCVAQGVSTHNKGMSLRDYFATHCPPEWLNLEGWSIADCILFLGLPEDTKYSTKIHYVQVITRLAYQYADEMLKVREL